MSESITMRVTWREKSQIEAYAKIQNMSVSSMMKSLFFEKLEDEYDLKLIDEYESSTDTKLYTLAEAKKVLGL